MVGGQRDPEGQEKPAGQGQAGRESAEQFRGADVVGEPGK